MKTSRKQVIISISSLALLVSCSKVSLHGDEGGTAPPAGNAGNAASIPSSSGLLNNAQQQTAPPPVSGEWEVDYEFNGNNFMGTATLSQNGNSLGGNGVDQDGKQWQIESGQFQGLQVAFNKRYANSTSPPIVYTGEMKYLQTPEYTGWAMEGTYSATRPDGSTVGGKWVANPTAAAAPAGGASPGQ